MSTFHLLIKTPDISLLDIQAQSLMIRALDGNITILADHEDTVMPLDVCVAEVLDENNQIIKLVINGGVLHVKKNVVFVSTTKGVLIDKKDKDLEKQTLEMQNQKTDILLEVKDALEHAGFYEPEMELSVLLEEERMRKYEFLNEIR